MTKMKQKDRPDLAERYRNGARHALRDIAKGLNNATTNPLRGYHGLNEENAEAYREGFKDQQRIFHREYPGE